MSDKQHKSYIPRDNADYIVRNSSYKDAECQLQKKKIDKIQSSGKAEGYFFIMAIFYIVYWQNWLFLENSS